MNKPLPDKIKILVTSYVGYILNYNGKFFGILKKNGKPDINKLLNMTLSGMLFFRQRKCQQFLDEIATELKEKKTFEFTQDTLKFAEHIFQFNLFWIAWL